MCSGLDVFACLHEKKAEPHRQEAEEKHGRVPDFEWHGEQLSGFTLGADWRTKLMSI